MIHIRKFCIGFVIGPVLLFSSGCSIGPQSMKYSSRQYNNVILQHSEEQLLLNIIRLRYGEPPLFLEAGPVQANFEYYAEANTTSSIGGAPSTVSPGGTLSYKESPTITYSVLRGAKFTAQILKPMSMDQFAYLLRLTSTDLVMLVTVQKLGELSNRLYGGVPPAQAPEDDPCADFKNFKKLVGAWEKLYSDEQLEFTLTSGNPIKIGDIGKPAKLECDNQVDAVKEGLAYYDVGAITPTPAAGSDAAAPASASKGTASRLAWLRHASTPTPTSAYELKKLGSPAILITVHFHTPTPIAPLLAAGGRGIGDVPTPASTPAVAQRKEGDEELSFRDGEDYKAKIKKLLGVEPEECKGYYTIRLVSDEYEREPRGPNNGRPGEVQVQLRSFLHSLAFIGQAIDIPPSDVYEVLGLKKWPSGEEFEREKERLCKSMSKRKARNAEVSNCIKRFPLTEKDENNLVRVTQSERVAEEEKIDDVVRYITGCRSRATRENADEIKKYEIERECLKGVMEIKNESSFLGYERKKPFVKTRYNGHDFYISSDDQQSRGTFMILSLIFELMSGEVRMFTPLPIVNVGAK